MNSRILIVDDNALNRKLASELLEIEGYEISTCDDAEEVLQCLAGAGLPDLILMDISLPGMDGLTLTRQLRSEPRMAGVVIVALTAFAMKGDEQTALDAGCDGYITKPIDPRQRRVRWPCTSPTANTRSSSA
jgi:CheY-like chemotaxis protein